MIGDLASLLQNQVQNRLQLGALPTPLVQCLPMSVKHGVTVDLKRDDLIGDMVTGTKVRALSFMLWQAVEDGVTDLVTAGEPTSNQCRLVAMLGARLGMNTHILLKESVDRDEDDNVAIMNLYGAHLQTLPEHEWRLHGMAAKRLMSRIRKAGGKALFVPFGCGGLPGALGIIDLAREILAQHDGGRPYSHFIVPTGSGATLFALDLALQLDSTAEAHRPDLIGVSVAQDTAALLQQIDRHYARTGSALGQVIERSDRLAIDDSWRDMPPAELFEALRRVVDTYGMLPDPIYVLRSFLTLERLISTGEVNSQSRVLLLVSGACRTFHAARTRAIHAARTRAIHAARTRAMGILDATQ